MPDEPLFPDETDYIARFPEEMPVSVKCWCFATMAINAVATVIGSLISRDLVPTFLCLIFTSIVPINMMLTWRHMTKQFNLYRDNQIPLQLPPMRTSARIEWLAVAMLIAGPAVLIYTIYLHISAGI